jgi:Tfp pilus assembly protein PilF
MGGVMMVPDTRRTCLLFVILLLLSACGPDTIFLRPTLDTPEQHVKNGNSLLARGKIDAADTEFFRAVDLDRWYAPAYVGIALVQGYRGDVEAGFETLQKAEALVSSPDEQASVAQGYEELKKMQ